MKHLLISASIISIIANTCLAMSVPETDDGSSSAIFLQLNNGPETTPSVKNPHVNESDAMSLFATPGKSVKKTPPAAKRAHY